MIANPEVADVFRKRAKVGQSFFINVVCCFVRTTCDEPESAKLILSFVFLHLIHCDTSYLHNVKTWLYVCISKCYMFEL